MNEHQGEVSVSGASNGTAGLSITPFFEPESFTWSYLVADEAQRRAALIDPVWVYDPVTGQADRAFCDLQLAQLAERGWQLDWVLETHAHADHLSAGRLLCDETGARLVIGRGICSVQKNFARVYHLPDFPADGRQFDQLVQEGDVLPLGDLEIQVMETPGHTNDSVTYRVGDAAFIGDTLFAPDYGTARCDFPGGDAGMLFDSIHRLHALPDGTRLFLCHDYPKPGETPQFMVPVEASRHENIHLLNAHSREAFIALREGRDSKLGLPRLILPSLQVNIRGGTAPEAEANGATYLKIPFGTTIPALLEDRECAS